MTVTGKTLGENIGEYSLRSGKCTPAGQRSCTATAGSRPAGASTQVRAMYRGENAGAPPRRGQRPTASTPRT